LQYILYFIVQDLHSSRQTWIVSIVPHWYEAVHYRWSHEVDGR